MNPVILAILITVVALAGSYLIGKRMSEQVSSAVAAGLGIFAAYGWKFLLGVTEPLSVLSILMMIGGVLICGAVARMGRKAK